jgi:HEAT repeat protein
MQNRPTLWNGIEVPYGASVEELAKRTDDAAPSRWAAFVALAHTPGDSALEVLKDRAGSADAHVRRIAVEAIGVHPDGHQLRAVILSLLSDRDGFVVRSACDAAARHGLTDAHDPIVRLLSAADGLTRGSALRAVRELWQEADFPEVLRVFTSDTSDEVRKEAGWTLYSLASSDNWRTLFALWRTSSVPRHRTWACELAAMYGGPEMLADLRSLSGDADGHVRNRADDAINALKERRLTTGE